MDRQLLVTLASDTKASEDGAQIYLRKKHAALLGSTHLTNDKVQRPGDRLRSSSKEQSTTPSRVRASKTGAIEIKCISRPAVVSHDSATWQTTASMIEFYFERLKIAATNSLVL
jgi:hypothetical protein